MGIEGEFTRMCVFLTFRTSKEDEHGISIGSLSYQFYVTTIYVEAEIW